MARHTFSRTREFVYGSGGIEKLTLEFRQLKPSPLQRFILVRNATFDEAETRRGFSPYHRSWLITEVTLHKRTHFFVMKEDRVLTNPRQPPLQHHFNQSVVFLVCSSRSLGQWQCGDYRLRSTADDGLVKLLKLEVGS